ncbi:hypothetical protein [Lysobacter gummosus]
MNAIRLRTSSRNAACARRSAREQDIDSSDRNHRKFPENSRDALAGL